MLKTKIRGVSALPIRPRAGPRSRLPRKVVRGWTSTETISALFSVQRWTRRFSGRTLEVVPIV